MIGSMINKHQFNSVGINGGGATGQIPTQAVVIYNQTGITLDWSPIDTATGYFIQVSLYADFRTTFVNTTVTLSTYSFTDSQPNGQKRFWRWAPTIDGANRLNPWSEVGSYWLDTALSQQLVLNRNEWGIANPNDMTDQYDFVMFPTSVYTKRNIYRSQKRNRLGELLSEFLTVKGFVTLSFTGQQFLEISQFSEIERYHNDFRTFFVATFKDGQLDNPMPNVWLAQLSDDPSFTMIAAGRPDLLSGTLTFEEV